MPESRKLLLVDDHEMVRVGVKLSYPELKGVPVEWLEATCLQDAIAVYSSNPGIDAVLLDLNLPDCRGLQGLRHFLEAHPAARVAVFSGTQDEFVVRQARSLGAVAYLCKGALRGQMQETLFALLRTEAPSTAVVNGTLFPRSASRSLYDRVSDLGPRHLEILELVLSGCTNIEISTSTKLSLGTVKNYVSSLLLALDVRSRSHLISLFR